MVDSDTDAAAVKFPPPLVYLGAIVLGALLHMFAIPLSVPGPPSANLSLAAVTAIAGLILLSGAIGLFRRTGQDPKPWKSTPEVLTQGVYRWTRNPMYVGMALMQAAIGFGLENGWIVVFIPLVLVLIYSIAIRHEERYLEGKFGDTYREYAASVRRWL